MIEIDTYSLKIMLIGYEVGLVEGMGSNDNGFPYFVIPCINALNLGSGKFCYKLTKAKNGRQKLKYLHKIICKVCDNCSREMSLYAIVKQVLNYCTV